MAGMTKARGYAFIDLHNLQQSSRIGDDKHQCDASGDIDAPRGHRATKVASAVRAGNDQTVPSCGRHVNDVQRV